MISISVHVRPAIWMKCIPAYQNKGRNQAKRYFQALLTEFSAGIINGLSPLFSSLSLARAAQN